MPTSKTLIDRLRELLGPQTVFLPVKSGDKFPWDHDAGRGLTGWQKTTLEKMTPEYFKNLERGNISVLQGAPSDHLCSFDIDDDSLVPEFLEANPWLNESFRTKGQRGANVWLRIAGSYPRSGKIVREIDKAGKVDSKAIGEFRALGFHTVVAGVHPSGKSYEVLVEKPPAIIEWSLVQWPWGWKLSPKREKKTINLVPCIVEIDRKPLLERARRCLAEMPPAISGEGGHNKTFHVACTLVKGFGLRQPEALLLLQEYNQRCIPPWTDSELVHKIEDAEKATDDRENGYLARHPLFDERPKVRLPGPNRLLSEFASDCGRHVVKGGYELFQRGGIVVTTNPQRQGLTKMTDVAFRTWFEKVAVPFQIKGRGENIFKFGKTMSREEAEGTLRSEEFWSTLRPVRHFNTVRLPVERVDKTIQLLPPGYDGEHQIFTEVKLEYQEDMPFEEAQEVFKTLYGEFCFADQGRSVAVAVSSLLTLFCAGMLPIGAVRPCFIATANDTGAGKGTIIKISLISVSGSAQMQAYTHNDDEMRKNLTTAILEARPYIALDNVRGKIISATLEAFLTSREWTDRLLGKSERISGENLATVFISGNDLEVSADLRRRSLFMDLFLPVERAEDRSFTRPLDDSTLLASRARVLAAAWAFVRHWNNLGRPPATVISSNFPEWSAIIGGIVEACGFGCPCEKPALRSSDDTETRDMRTLLQLLFEANGSFVVAMDGRGLIKSTDQAGTNYMVASDGVRSTKAIDFSMLMMAARSSELFQDFLTSQPTASAKEEASQKSKLGKMLKRYADRPLGNGFRLRITGSGHSRGYSIEQFDMEHGRHG